MLTWRGKISLLPLLAIFILNACSDTPRNVSVSLPEKQTQAKDTSLKTVKLPLTQHGLQIFKSDIPAGMIGVGDGRPVDDPFDNLFHIALPEKNGTTRYFLQYELFGVADDAGVAQSINDAQATGGLFVCLNHSWSIQKKEIPAGVLLKGDNVIRFGLSEAAKYYYRVKNVCILASTDTIASAIILSNPPVSYAGRYYLHGFIQASDTVTTAKLYCGDQQISLINGEFEAVLDSSSISKDRQIHLHAVLPGNKTLSKTIKTPSGETADWVFKPEARGITTVGLFKRNKGALVKLQHNKVNAGIAIPSKALPIDKPISVTALRDVDMPALNEDLVNVTAGAEGYRFLPHGSKFTTQAALSLPYDSTRIPDGYTADDIRTYFFDESKRKWVVLPLDSIEKRDQIVLSKTTHFTDMINGIIKVPESPQTQGYTPTSIKDFKAADPSAGIDFINPPSADYTGGASLSFNLKIPSGRQGLQPSLSVQYSNEGGNGWMGLGWNLSIPSIRIDNRWGVPRYDASLETETYMIGGEQLSPINNRGSFVAREAERIFHPRVEGSFNKIIRHGDSPAGYWWEVVSKNGTRSYYGGLPSSGVEANAVLKDASGHIGYWALLRVQDLHGNFVNYQYETVTDVGLPGGTVPGTQLYIRHIAYTGFGTSDGPYTVDFVRDRQLGEPKRQDIEINARNGFKMVTADLLRKVTMAFNGQVIRSYAFNYTQGEFYKTLLKSVQVLDDKNSVFFEHNFDYYDDIKDNTGNTALLKPVEDWHVSYDGINGDLINPITGFTGEGSALNTSKSSNVGGGLAVTIGLTLDYWSKRGTIGGSFNYDHGNNDGLVSMVDINGDGLSDKVFKQGGQLFYRAGSKTGQFGDKRPINGIGGFSSGSSNTFAGGIQIVPYFGFLGYNHSSTTSKTSVYFSDFNKDGLIDIAAGGQVYFNHLNANGDPTFEPNSTNTPSPIFLGGTIDKQFLAPDLAKQAQQEKDYPLQDAVRMWEAPFDGTIAIEAPVHLIAAAGTLSKKQDGVRASIQVGASVLWSTTIAANDFSEKTPVGLSHVTIKKGQHVYFRLQSVYNGENDVVAWDPVINYQSSVSPAKDANGKSVSRYQASEDFLLDGSHGVGIGKEGTIKTDGNFVKAVTSDSVTLFITKEHNQVYTTLATHVYAPQDVFNGVPDWPSLSVQPEDILHFTVNCGSYIDLPSVNWQPHYAYTSFADGTPATNSNGKPTVEGIVIPQHSNVNIWLKPTPLLVGASRDTFSITPKLSGTGSGSVVFTIKGVNRLYAKQTLPVVNGTIQNSKALGPFEVNAGEPLYLEYATTDRKLALSFANVQAIKTKDTSYLDSHGTVIRKTLSSTLNAGLFTSPADNYFGPLYRGWGAFSIKGDQANAAIDEAKLNQNELKNYPSDPNQYNAADTSIFQTLASPAKTYFVIMTGNASSQDWMGYDTSVYVTAGFMSSSRLWMHDVSVDSLMIGQSLWAPEKITTSEASSYALGVTGGLGSATYSTSKAKTLRNLDVMDMNGDGYPDVMHEDDVQYTLPNGGLETSGKVHNLGAPISEGNSDGFNLGGHYALASGKNDTKSNSEMEPKTAGNSIGVSGNINKNQEQAVTTWLDINGDGLPDRISADGNVALNLGYSFAPAEHWFDFGIDSNTNSGVGAGLGINFASGSFEAGVGLSRTSSDNFSTFMDVNGDGLADKLSYNGKLWVRLNTGNGFAAPVPWSGVPAVSKNVSTGESANIAYTYTFTLFFLPIKICINPSFSAGHGVSRASDQLMDMDGDGIADAVHSENDSNLTVMRSTIGRTNMLRSVQRPMGSWFALDYKRVGNSYAMPQSKWVLKSTEIFDGVNGDGADTMRNNFTYGGGYYDRHEREFYGFDTVTATQLNTLNDDSAYRSKVQVYITKSYYTKGLVAQEWLQDANGNRFTETDNSFDVRKVEDSCYFPALVQTRKLYYEGKPSAGASTATHFDYDSYGNTTKIADDGDGSQQDLIIANVTYHNNDALYIKGIPASIVVTTIEGQKRKKATTIDAQANITSISQYLSADSVAVYRMDYDDYGNLAKIIHPLNYKGDTMWYAYTYDDVVHNYVTKVQDAYGYSSTSSYEYLFGTVTGTTSMSNEPMHYRVDNRGRMISLTGPYEIAAGKPYTIAFEYYPNAATPYAITHHYDPEYSDDINTITFMDGLGRAIQVKKQVSLFKGKGAADEERMVISGQTIYDAFGRTTKSYFPVTEPLGSANSILSNVYGNIQSSSSYDVEDRPIQTVLADGATTKHVYGISNSQLSTRTTDALNNQTEVLTDVRNRQRVSKQLSGPLGVITTLYDYNALDELVRVTDNGGNKIQSTYDNLGRKTSVLHPDQGLTELRYDLAGNMIAKITAQLRKEISEEGAVHYLYDRERLTGIDYPKNYQNRVTYKYGAPGSGDRAGKLILQEDASGGAEFYYGKLGEVTKTIRTVLINSVFYTTYVSEQEYDTWNRVKKMVYADSETVTYSYNRSGGLQSMKGYKLGNHYSYVDQLGYDEYEQRVYLRYGNGTETRYAYDSLRRRLTTLQVTNDSGLAIMRNNYAYDAVSNITSLINNVKAQEGKLVGYAKQNYGYDNLYRLTSAFGIFKGAADSGQYNLNMQYDNLYNITRKTEIKPGTNKGYDFHYSYNGASPHQPSQIDNTKYSYDLNGNLTGHGTREYFWDEDNRLMAVLDSGNLREYTYDASGERVIKSSGGVQGTWVNGAPAGLINHYDNYTVYVSPYLVCRKGTFTKHFYIESQRISTKIGTGDFTNISFPIPPITAGGIDYIQRAKQLQHDRIAYDTSMHLSPGPPTNKLFYALPQNSHIEPPVLVDSTASSIPQGWPGNTTPPTTGPPIFVQPIPSNDSVHAGYGFRSAGHFAELQQYFYHSDHLGSTSYLTNILGDVVQHEEYIPFGETFIEEHKGSYESPYLFNAKERDDETGLYYYGARYYNPVTSVWLSVDPMTEKYPGVSPYNYTLNNPVRLADPDGKDISDYVEIGASLLLNISPVGEVKGLAEAVTGKDLVTGQKLALWERALGVVPLVGGLAKTAKAARGVETLGEAAEAGKNINKELNVLHNTGAVEGAAKQVLTSFEDVSKTVEETGKLPSNFITKAEAKSLGWNPKLGNLHEVAPGKSIGGDIFKNSEGLLPQAEGRIWREADINYSGGFRGSERILYSNDKLIYKTTDHYKTFSQIK